MEQREKRGKEGEKQKSILWLQLAIHSKTTRMNSSPFPAHITALLLQIPRNHSQGEDRQPVPRPPLQAQYPKHSALRQRQYLSIIMKLQVLKYSVQYNVTCDCYFYSFVHVEAGFYCFLLFPSCFPPPVCVGVVSLLALLHLPRPAFPSQSAQSFYLFVFAVTKVFFSCSQSCLLFFSTSFYV